MSQPSCRSCGAPLVWVQMASGKPMPCDPPLLTVVTEDGRIVQGRQSHFATCPNAAQHRRRPQERAGEAP